MFLNAKDKNKDFKKIQADQSRILQILHTLNPNSQTYTQQVKKTKVQSKLSFKKLSPKHKPQISQPVKPSINLKETFTPSLPSLPETERNISTEVIAPKTITKLKKKRLRKKKTEMFVSLNSTTTLDPLENSAEYIENLYNSVDSTERRVQANDPINSINSIHRVSNSKKIYLDSSIKHLKKNKKLSLERFLKEHGQLKYDILKKKKKKGVFMYNKESKKINKFYSEDKNNIYSRLEKVDKLVSNAKSINAVRKEMLTRKVAVTAVDPSEYNSKKISKLLTKIKLSDSEIRHRLVRQGI